MIITKLLTSAQYNGVNVIMYQLMTNTQATDMQTAIIHVFGPQMF